MRKKLLKRQFSNINNPLKISLIIGILLIAIPVGFYLVVALLLAKPDPTNSKYASMINAYPGNTYWKISNYGFGGNNPYSEICLKTKDTKETVISYYNQQFQSLSWKPNGSEDGKIGYLANSLSSDYASTKDIINYRSANTGGNGYRTVNLNYLGDSDPNGCNFKFRISY